MAIGGRRPITRERGFAGGLARTIDGFVDVKNAKAAAYRKRWRG